MNLNSKKIRKEENKISKRKSPSKKRKEYSDSFWIELCPNYLNLSKEE
jgi:hypothetical protein